MICPEMSNGGIETVLKHSRIDLCDPNDHGIGIEGVTRIVTAQVTSRQFDGIGGNRKPDDASIILRIWANQLA